MADSREYVKLWLSYDDYFREYDDASVGALVRAMIAYRRNRTEPEFSGPERFIWPAMRRDIDESVKAQEEFQARCSENGKKGGRPRAEEKPNPFSEKPKNPTLFSETQKSQGYRTKDKGQGQGQGQRTEENIARAKRFTPPTLAEVQSYVAERHSAVDPQAFIDFYESKGWMVGKTPMKDWKAACRNAERWERWSKGSAKQPFVYDYGSMEGSL